MIDKIRGALYGVAIGDALGGTTEMMAAPEIQRKYGRVTEIMGGGYWNLVPGETTDDTAMTIAVARGILKDPDHPIPQIGEEFLAWAATRPKYIGNIIAHVFRLYQGDWFAAAERAHEELNGLTAGNGSLMRCLPVALAYADVSRMEEVTVLQSKMTHCDSLADEACRVYNRIASRVLKGQPLQSALAAEVQGTRYESALYAKPDVVPDGFVVRTFQWVVYILSTTPDFEPAVQVAANLGGDSDTIGAIAGGLAGLDCGFHALPERYVESILVRKELDELAVGLHRLYTRS